MSVSYKKEKLQEFCNIEAAKNIWYPNKSLSNSINQRVNLLNKMFKSAAVNTQHRSYVPATMIEVFDEYLIEVKWQSMCFSLFIKDGGKHTIFYNWMYSWFVLISKLNCQLRLWLSTTQTTKRVQKNMIRGTSTSYYNLGKTQSLFWWR